MIAALSLAGLLAASLVPQTPARGVVVAAGGGGTVTIGNVSPFTVTAFSATTQTNHVVVGSESGRVLYEFIAVGISGGGESITAVSSSIDGALAQVSGAGISDANFVNSQAWFLVNPTAGTHIITVTSTDSTEIRGTIGLYVHGANTSDPDDTVVTGSGTGADPSGSVTLTTGEMALGFLTTDDGTLNTPRVLTGTEQGNANEMGSDIGANLASNTGTGSVTIQWNTDADGYAWLIIPVNAAP